MVIKPRRIVALICVLTVVALLPPIIRTVQIGQTADGLVTLAGLRSDQLSSNPWNQDFHFISPTTAVWILETYEWPYDNREHVNNFWTDRSWPLVHQALAARYLGPETERADARMFRLLEVFIERGEPLDSRHQGFTALQSAILFADVEAVKLIVGNGADISARIVKEGGPSNGMSAVEFSAFLYSKSPERHAETYEYLRSLSSKSS